MSMFVVPPSYSVAVVDVLPSVVPPSYSVAVVDVQRQQCQPLFRTGVGVLDQVVFCVGSYGITVSVLVAAFLLLLFRRR
jgi:uncharacterized protein (TIGR03382 family)